MATPSPLSSPWPHLPHPLPGLLNSTRWPASVPHLKLPSLLTLSLCLLPSLPGTAASIGDVLHSHFRVSALGSLPGPSLTSVSAIALSAHLTHLPFPYPRIVLHSTKEGYGPCSGLQHQNVVHSNRHHLLTVLLSQWVMIFKYVLRFMWV